MVMVNRNHPKIMKHDNKSGVSEHMGITLLFKRHPVYPSPVVEQTNYTAVHLLLSIDTSENNEFWASIPSARSFYRLDPTYLVFRADGQDITVQQIDALSCYCKDILTNVLEGPELETLEPEDKETILDVWCSAEKFRAYFETFKTEKLALKKPRICIDSFEEMQVGWKDAVPPP
jgi:hypothetical protein